MPVIPSLDAPQVSPPMPTGNNYQTADGATPAAFGAGVGQAIQGLANVGMQAGDMLSHHAVALQGMNNERDALNANTDATQKIADRWNQFASLNGKDAADAYPQFTKDIAQIHQDAMGALGNPEAKMMFDRAGKALIQRFTMAASTRAADENRRSQGQANQSAATSQQDTAVLFRNDPNAFATSLAVGRNNLANAAGPSGWDDETLKLKQAQFTDQTYSKAVAAMAVEDPMKALGWYKAHQDQIGGEAQAAIEQHLKPMVMANQARVVADRIIGGLPGQAASAITGEATAQGQPPARALTWAKLESNIGAAPDQPGNPHTGLFQMGPDEWKANGGDPSERGQTSAEARVGVKSMAGSMDTAGAAVGGKAEDWQGYLVHQQGQAGGPALLKADPAANVVDALTPAYRGDRAKAEAAITANGGNANGTVGDFLGMVQAKYAKAEGTVSVPSGQAQSTDIRDNAASLLAQARATPDPFGGDDPQWHDMLESHVKARIGEIEYGQAQADRGAQQTLLSAAIGIPANGAAGNVTKPTDLGTLLKDPTFSAAWSTAKPQTQQSILQVLEHNARMEEPPLTQDAMSRYYTNAPKS